MVQIKLQASGVAFVLAAATIAPVVALPVASAALKNGSVFICRDLLLLQFLLIVYAVVSSCMPATTLRCLNAALWTVLV